MQPHEYVQMIFDYRQNSQTASYALRWRVMEGLNVALEPGFDPQVIVGLSKRGHRIQIGKTTFDGTQVIYRACDGSDHRKDGQAVGFLKHTQQIMCESS